MVDFCVLTYGSLDCAFNNAGIIGAVGPIVDIDDAAFERTIAVNLKGVWLSVKYEIMAMTKGRGGAIVNTSSGVTEFCTPGMSVYGSSKGGVDVITRTIAVEWGPRGIRVNAVQPGNIGTPMMFGALKQETVDKLAEANPLRRIGAPEDVGRAAAWLCSPQSSYVNGETIKIDGGISRQWIQF